MNDKPIVYVTRPAVRQARQLGILPPAWQLPGRDAREALAFKVRGAIIAGKLYLSRPGARKGHVYLGDRLNAKVESLAAGNGEPYWSVRSCYQQGASASAHSAERAPDARHAA